MIFNKVSPIILISILCFIVPWNGTNWTEVNNLSLARRNLAGAGISTAGLAIGGEDPSSVSAATEEWNVGNVSVTFSDS